MKTNHTPTLLFAALAFIAASCTTAVPEEQGLKDALAGKFYMGTALNEWQIAGVDTAAIELVLNHFNSVTAENCMKSGEIHPKEDSFAFDLSDRFIEFAEANQMYTVGHCLIWHSQAPRWFFRDDEGNDVSREVLIERMRSHINAVVGRYKGRVDCWDVVNEAFEDDGSWRKTKFYEIIGEEFMELAFQFAHEADPDAELLYNDYSMHLEGRRNAVVEMVNNLKSKGVQIDGIGMQAHYGLDHPTPDELEASILAFAGTGVDVHITELDVNVLPNPDWSVNADVRRSFEYRESMNPYKEGLPDSVQVALDAKWLELFGMFFKHQDKIRRVTTWGVADHHSWKNGWPMPGRTNYPLLFDREYQPKPVVEKIIKAAGES